MGSSALFHIMYMDRTARTAAVTISPSLIPASPFRSLLRSAVRLHQLEQLPMPSDLSVPICSLLVGAHRQWREALGRPVALPLFRVVDLLDQVLIIGRGLV